MNIPAEFRTVPSALAPKTLHFSPLTPGAHGPDVDGATACSPANTFQSSGFTHAHDSRFHIHLVADSRFGARTPNTPFFAAEPRCSRLRVDKTNSDAYLGCGMPRERYKSQNAS